MLGWYLRYGLDVTSRTAAAAFAFEHHIT